MPIRKNKDIGFDYGLCLQEGEQKGSELQGETTN